MRSLGISALGHWIFALGTVLGCGSSSTPPSGSAATDAGPEDLEDDSGVVCPPPLGTPKPRPAKRPPAHPLDDTLRINHIQSEATHNSYHLKPDSNVPEHQYSHAPLATQLDTQGVRGLELDTRWNDACGRYEVFHLPLLDPRTTCMVFTDCLQQIRDWSDAHQGHHPLFIQIEPKDGTSGEEPAAIEARFVAMEKEVLSVFPRESLITPDEIKGTSASVAAGLAERGWPTLGAARGRVLFYMDRHDAMRDAYTHGRKDLAGRLFFVDSDESDPFAAVFVLNDPIGKKDQIASALAKGYLVRVFSASLTEAKVGDHSVDAAALASGAQIISTDLPAKVGGIDFFVEMTGGTPSRCSPVTAPATCTAAAIESPSLLSTP